MTPWCEEYDKAVRSGMLGNIVFPALQALIPALLSLAYSPCLLWPLGQALPQTIPDSLSVKIPAVLCVM